MPEPRVDLQTLMTTMEEDVIECLTLPHPWLPGAVFQRYPELRQIIIDAVTGKE